MSETLVIENLLDEEALSVNKRRELWATNRARMLPVVRGLKELDARITFPGTLDVQLSGDKHKLASAVRILRTHGFATSSKGPKKGDSSWCAFFNADGCSMEVWFSFSSTVCRRVKVGTKMVEQDVFETVCDELVLPESAAA